MTFNRKIANLITTSGDLKGTAANSVSVLDSADVQAIVDTRTITVVDSTGALPISGLIDGQRAFVPIDSSNSRLYISNGSGWYNFGLVNLSPSLTLTPSGAITLATDGTASTVTITAIDSDNANLTFSVDSDGNMSATGTTVTQDSSVFTITPLTQDSGGVAGNFTLTFRVSDRISQAFENKDFSITFQSTGTLISSASSVNEGSSITFTLPVTGYSDGDTFPYTISGIQAVDLNPASLSGNLTVSGSNATATITTLADTSTEGNETMTFSADGQTVDVTINDTSLSPPTYSLSQNAIYVSPGNTITYTLTTTNVANGTVIPYTIGNKSPYTQFGYAGNYGYFEPGNTSSIYGSFTVNNNTATATETIRSAISRTGPATYTLTLNNGGDNIDTQVRTNASVIWQGQGPYNGGSTANGFSGSSYSQSMSLGWHNYMRMCIFGITWSNQSGSSTPNLSSARIGSTYASGSTGGIIQAGGSQRFKAAIVYIYLPTSVNSNNTDTVYFNFSSSMTNGTVKLKNYPISGGITSGKPVVHDYDTTTVGTNVGQMDTTVNTNVNVSGDTKYFLVSVAGCNDTSTSVGTGGYSHNWSGTQALNGGWNVSSSYGTAAWADNLSNYTYFGNYTNNLVRFRFSSYASGSMATAVFK